MLGQRFPDWDPSRAFAGGDACAERGGQEGRPGPEHGRGFGPRSKCRDLRAARGWYWSRPEWQEWGMKEPVADERENRGQTRVSDFVLKSL